MNQRPKKYYARKAMSSRRQHFVAGDEVTGAALSDTLRFGDMFLMSEREMSEIKIPKKKTPTSKADPAETEGA